MHRQGEDIYLLVAVAPTVHVVADGFRISDVLAVGWRMVCYASQRLLFVFNDASYIMVVYEEI
jgi:hypothetical protein